MIDLDKVKARLGSIPDSKLGQFSHAIVTLLKVDLPDALDEIEDLTKKGKDLCCAYDNSLMELEDLRRKLALADRCAMFASSLLSEEGCLESLSHYNVAFGLKDAVVAWRAAQKGGRNGRPE
jgi:hypothetical protein